MMHYSAPSLSIAWRVVWPAVLSAKEERWEGGRRARHLLMGADQIGLPDRRLLQPEEVWWDVVLPRGAALSGGVGA